MTHSKLFVILIFFLTNQLVAYSQARVLNSPKNKFLLEDIQRVKTTIVTDRDAEDWKVFANKNSCKIYSNADVGSSVVQTTGFLDEFYAVDEKAGWIKVVPASNVINSIYKAGAVLGWIPKKDLVLFQEGLKMRNFAYRKAIFTYSMRNLHKNFNANFYSMPDLNNGGIITSAERTIRTYFIYDETDKAVLLGERHKFEMLPKEIIVGWVDKNSVEFWNTKVCFEPNFREWAWQERVQHPWTINWINSDAQLWQEKKTNMEASAWPGYGTQKRFNYINTFDDSKNIKTGVFYNPSADVGATAVDNMIVKREIANLIKTYSPPKINIAFVIDGTQSMDAAFKAVTQSLQQISQEVENKVKEYNTRYNTTASVNWGAVVYRDTESQNKGQFFKLGEKTPAQLIKELDWEKQHGKADPDMSIEEAVFWGLRTGLDLFDHRERETNLIIMIGDAGDHHRGDIGEADITTVSKQELIDEIKTANVNIFNYQFQRYNNVHCTNSKRKDVLSYEEYIDDFKSIMQSVYQPITLEARMDAKDYSFKNRLIIDKPVPVSGTQLMYFESTGITNTKLVVFKEGIPRNPANLRHIPVDIMVKQATSDIYNTISSAYYFDYILNNILTHQGGLSGILEELQIDLDHLENENASSVSKIFSLILMLNKFKGIFDSKEHIYAEGWFPFAESKNVVMIEHFIAHDNLSNLLSRFETVIDSESEEDLVFAFVEMLAEMLGIENIKENDSNWKSLLEYPVVDFLGKLLDIPMIKEIIQQNHSYIGDITIGELYEPDNYEVVQDIVINFRDSYEGINNWMNSNDMPYDYISGTRFYYLPTDMYPFCNLQE